MLRRPAIPRRAVVILLHQDPEKCVIAQPPGLFFAEFPKAGLSIVGGASREIRKRSLKQTSFQFFDLAILDSAAAESGKIHIGERNVKVFGALSPPDELGPSCSVVGSIASRANRVVRAVVGSGLVDRQELDKLESNSGDPINKLPQRTDIADSKIILAPQRKQRHENSRDLFSGEKFMKRMTNDQ